MTSQIQNSKFNRVSLPIDGFLKTIDDALAQTSSVILLAEPGAGKSTRVPAHLLASDPQAKWILIQPRRWAARLVAERIAEENNWKLGQEVGLQIRFENRTSKHTRLWVMTEGVLLRHLTDDPELKGFAGVILDEFHERSLDVDLALALLKELQEAYRPDLKLMVMSATLDPLPLQKYLPASVLLEVPGRVFPVDKKYLGEVSIARAVGLAFNHPALGGGDGLVFLPGVREIDRAIQDVKDQSIDLLLDFDLLPFHSRLSDQEQSRVFEKTVKRKLIFSTNIAETSITLPRVTFVIDSGFAKIMRTDPRQNQDRLETVRISRASSDQRAGRAGRVQAGVCFRLWSEGEQTQLRHQETPEIHRVNLAGAYLYLALQGVRDFEKFSWFEKPRKSSHEAACLQLESLQLVRDGVITDFGRRASALPMSPDQAVLLLHGVDAGHPSFSLRFCALFDSGFQEEKGSVALDSLLKKLSRLGQRDMQVAEQLAKRLGLDLRAPEYLSSDDFSDYLMKASPIRFFVQGKKVGRRNVTQERGLSPLPDCGWILRSRESDQSSGVPVILVQSWIPIDLSDLVKQATLQTRIYFDEAQARVRASKGLCFQDLALEPETEVKCEGASAQTYLLQAVMKDPIKVFCKFDGFQNWIDRIRVANEQGLKLDIPWEELIQAALDSDSRLLRISDFEKFPWRDYLENTYPDFQKLQDFVPEKIQVPSGSWLTIDYTAEPKLSVRLQEVFGWLATPTLAKGKVSIVLELLSPGYKPIQVTRDLASFWRQTYFEVKKELKARYPKHSWPDNPLDAKPVAKGRPTR